jgi:hypothetical protein
MRTTTALRAPGRPLPGLLLATALLVAACDKPPRPAADAAAAPPPAAEPGATPFPAEGPIPPDGPWVGAGRTENRTPVYVDTTSLRDSAIVRLGRFRIRHQRPFETDSGRKVFVLTITDLVARCGPDPVSVPRRVVHYADTAATEEVSRREDLNVPYLHEQPGSFGDVALKYLCSRPTMPAAAPR